MAVSFYIEPLTVAAFLFFFYVQKGQANSVFLQLWLILSFFFFRTVTLTDLLIVLTFSAEIVIPVS